MAHGDGSGRLDAHDARQVRSLAAPGKFADDDGSPDLAIRQANDHRSLVHSLRRGRLLVPLVAVALDIEQSSRGATEKTSEMSVVSMVTRDGRRGLLGFTGVDSLQTWNPTARPVPVAGVDAARAAIDADCEALVIDVLGPHTHVIPESDLVDLADVDRLEHARHVALSQFDRKFGPGRIDVSSAGDRLRVKVIDSTIDAQDLAASITARIASLVPAGVEILRN